MSEMSDLFEQVAAVARTNHTLSSASMVMRQASDRIHELETALNRMVQAHYNLSADTEGQYPPLDSGCIECTGGATPDRYNTGLCAYHNAKKVLGQS